MPNEDGQFELTLGNRQLLSVFFIVVILLGVFFTMGYIVGKNSTPVAAEVAAVHKDTVKSSIIVDSPAGPGEVPPPATATPVPVVTSPAASAEPVRTAPVKTDPPKAEPEKKAEKRAEKKIERAEPKEVRRIESQPTSGQTYLQLAATNKHEADVMVDVLRQKGFRAIAAEISDRQGTFRVLVGPIGDAGTNKMKADLQSAGFPGNAAIRRNF